jgi:Predicted esterase of the alpha-beta hydrolase superfamily
MVRLFIRALEGIFATKKHRDLRKALDEATCYDEWLGVAKKLDYSQGRDKWQCRIDDDTSYTYNWAFINELIMDMREARKKDDVMLALVVLQQCTRKNVGGIMNEDLFSFTNSGEPKFIVKEFLEEVVKTVKWLTEISTTSSRNCEEEETLEPSQRSKEQNENDRSRDMERNDKEYPTTAQSESGNSEQKCAVKKHLVQVVMEHAHILDHVVGPVQWAIHAATGGGRENGRIKEELTKISEECSSHEDSKKSGNHEGQNVLEGFDDVDKMRKQQREQVKIFLNRARAAYGRTALCLSGGAMMGCYHFGHVMALFEEGVLPHIISGTSAGSVVAAMLCTRTDEEIRRDMRPEVLVNRLTCFSKTWPDRLRNVYHQGCLFDQEEWLDLIQW